ncbi:MAG: tryptophan halogenase family protein [Fuerstiella sp.]
MAKSDSKPANGIALGSATNIVIVGGGTSGWMTAAMLSHSLTTAECCITVVDDGKGGIGVGEATIPSIIQLVRHLGVDEAEFMRACDATWKLGIQFCNWKEEGHTAWHPFGQCGAKIDHRDLFHYWLADQTRSYQSYSLNWSASLAGKSPHSKTSRSQIAADGAYAFHLNSEKLAGWLKQQAISNGTQVVADRIESVATDDVNQVSHVSLPDGTSLQADLFIDCTGFNGLLISKCQSADWVDYSDQLLCDKAVAMKLPATKLKQPFTNSQALSSGWAWDIPLMNGRGVGYVYSSHFISDEAAANELQQHVRSSQKVMDKSLHLLQMKVGRREIAWAGNVLAVGLSAGFIEPLESSGLHLIQTAVERLLKYLPTANGSTRAGVEEDGQSGLRSAYNAETAIQFDEIRDFVQLHYLLNQREEPFWKAAREAASSSALKHRLRLYDEIGMLDTLQPSAFPDASYYYLLAGNGRLPKRPAAFSLSVDSERLKFVLGAIQDQNRNALRELPLHEEMLQHVHLPPAAKAS